MTYSPAMHANTVTPEDWLRVIKRNFGENYLTEEQERILLEEGVQALADALPDEDPE